jgi:prepilin-type N-terminal cleavage/methylation domain-containing protein
MHFLQKPLGSGSKGNAGFTLIELAIVLVVIGLIIAAVLKGKDLIQDAAMLDFVTNPVREAQTAAMSYYNRVGQFPNAVTDGNNTTGPLYNMYQAGIKSVSNLKNPFTSGSDSLAIAFGTIQVTDSSGNADNYPVMLIQALRTATGGGIGFTPSSWTQSELGYANYLKKTIDGNLNWQAGSVRALSSLSITITYTALSSEINSNSSTTSTSVYDGFISDQTMASISSGSFVTPTAGQAFTLVYFYYQQPT